MSCPLHLAFVDIRNRAFITHTGVRGVGETSIVPPLAAVGNAIADAVGVRMTQVPMSPPRVLAALDDREGD